MSAQIVSTLNSIAFKNKISPTWHILVIQSTQLYAYILLLLFLVSSSFTCAFHRVSGEHHGQFPNYLISNDNYSQIFLLHGSPLYCSTLLSLLFTPPLLLEYLTSSPTLRNPGLLGALYYSPTLSKSLLFINTCNYLGSPMSYIYARVN